MRDLDLVDDDAWPEALAALARPPYREAVVDPVRTLLPDGTYADLPPYTAWWLRDHPVLDGREPAGLRAAGADPLLRGLYDEARTTLDEQFLHALGVRTTLAALLAEPHGPDEVLDRLTDPDAEVGHRQLHGIHSALARVDRERIEPLDVVRALPPLDPATGRRPAHTVVVDATEAVVADAPDLVQLLHPYPLLPVAPALAADLAERLHVSLASEVAGGRVLSEGVLHRVPAVVRELLPGCPVAYEEHEELLVVGPDGAEAAVDGAGTPGRTPRSRRTTRSWPRPRTRTTSSRSRRCPACCTRPPRRASRPGSPGRSGSGTGASRCWPRSASRTARTSCRRPGTSRAEGQPARRRRLSRR